MASNLTTENIKTLSQLDTIDVSNENDAYFLCGNGEKMNKISFNRLRKKVNGTILPTQKPKGAELGELWLDAVKIKDNISNRISDKGKFESLVTDKESKYYLFNKVAYCENENGEKSLFGENSFFDFIVLTKDLIVFFNKENVSLSKAIKRENGEIIGLNENYSGSISYEVLEVLNYTYPMENLNGFLFDNTDALEFQFFTFDLSPDGATFNYSCISSFNYSELGIVNGAKAIGMVLVTNGSYDADNSQVAILPKIDGAYYIEDLKICEHDINFCVVSVYTNSEIEKWKYNYIFIGENQATQFTAEKGTLEPFNLYTDETTLAECISGVQVLNGFYLLQKTTEQNIFSVVKYFINENLDFTKEKIFTLDFSNLSPIVDTMKILVDTQGALSQLDGASPEPLLYVKFLTETKSILVSVKSDYEYKMMLSYGDLVQEVQGYKGEQGVSIASVESETTQESGGENKIKITLSNGVEETFTIKNGLDGEVLQSQLDEVIEDLETLENSMSQRIADSIAEVVADAPEDFDTLKEMSNWIAEHKDDATAMNTAIAENKTAIDTEKEERQNADKTLQEQFENFCNDYLKNIFPIGSVVITTTENNPSSIYGGTWEQIAQGRTLVGVGTGTDAKSEIKTFAENETGGEYSHILTSSEIPSHTHTMTHGHSASGTNSSNVYTYKGSGKPSLNENTTTDYGASYGKTSVSVSVNNYSGNTGATGSGNAHNNMQPYLAVYFWKRTA
jgi:microcystin-dependent protein